MRESHFSLLAVSVVLTANFEFADDNSDESKAIEKIELLGGKVTRDEKLPGRPAIRVSLSLHDNLNSLA